MSKDEERRFYKEPERRQNKTMEGPPCTCGPDSDALENIECPTHGEGKLVDAEFEVNPEWWLFIVEEAYGRTLTADEIKIKLHPFDDEDKQESLGFVTEDLAAEMKYVVGLYLAALVIKRVASKGMDTMPMMAFVKSMELAESLINTFWSCVRLRYPGKEQLALREYNSKLALFELKSKSTTEKKISIHSVVGKDINAILSKILGGGE